MKAPGDAATLRQIYRMCEGMPLADLERFCTGTLNALTVASFVFERRFPAEHERWMIQGEDGDHLPEGFHL